MFLWSCFVSLTDLGLTSLKEFFIRTRASYSLESSKRFRKRHYLHQTFLSYIITFVSSSVDHKMHSTVVSQANRLSAFRESAHKENTFLGTGIKQSVHTAFGNAYDATEGRFSATNHRTDEANSHDKRHNIFLHSCNNIQCCNNRPARYTYILLRLRPHAINWERSHNVRNLLDCTKELVKRR